MESSPAILSGTRSGGYAPAIHTKTEKKEKLGWGKGYWATNLIFRVPKALKSWELGPLHWDAGGRGRSRGVDLLHSAGRNDHLVRANSHPFKIGRSCRGVAFKNPRRGVPGATDIALQSAALDLEESS